MAERTIRAEGSKDFGPCACCGNASRTVWGCVVLGDAVEATYFVQWTLGAIERHGANFDLVLGDGPLAEQKAVSLAFRRMATGPEFMVIDARERPIAKRVETCLAREEVVGTPLAKDAFAIVDVIWLHDRRIAEITGG